MRSRWPTRSRACDGHVVAQGLTYRFWDPSPDDVVLVHAAVTDEGEIVPDRDADDRTLLLRVAAGPGDVIEGRAGTVFVDDVKFDDIDDRAVRAGHRAERAVLPARRQPLGRRSTAAPSAPCSATRSSRACSPSSGRSVTSPSGSARARARRPAGSPAVSVVSMRPSDWYAEKAAPCGLFPQITTDCLRMQGIGL